MHINLALGSLVSLIADVLILLVSRLLNYIVAAYLIILGYRDCYLCAVMIIRGLPDGTLQSICGQTSTTPPSVTWNRRPSSTGSWPITVPSGI